MTATPFPAGAPSGHALVVARRTRALGTTAEVAVPVGTDVEAALTILRSELARIDAACSRFRADGEVLGLGAAGGRPVRVSQLLFTAVAMALAVAERTAGAVDPTVGSAVAAWGYDRDFAAMALDDPVAVAAPSIAAGCTTPRGVPGWHRVDLDPRARTVRVPAGTLLDLGASAKALAADLAATRIAGELRCGVLVSVGGDVAVTGPAPAGGWPVGIAAESGAPAEEVEQVVTIRAGGLASSSPLIRSWRRGGRLLHHIIDPATGSPAPLHWRLVSAVGPDCVAANAASTAAVVWGAEAPARLRKLGQAARLVATDGTVVTVNGWPEDPGPANPGATAQPGGGRRVAS